MSNRPVDTAHSADVELDDVDALYTDNDLWSAAFGADSGDEVED